MTNRTLPTRPRRRGERRAGHDRGRAGRPASPRTALALCLALLACGAGTAQEERGAHGEAQELEESSHTAADPNRLAGESSPYLLLHADNPVDWYPWGEEALERAREEGKPIFLSVGYSSCYWCHVMERKVFSDPEIAALMNRWFVNVKVDREERPDLDEIYMTATQLMTRSGGWPNSVFLTPDLEPFYAGTYFPPEAEHGRPGFPTVLRRIHEAWTERRDSVESDAARVADALREALSARAEPAEAVPGSEAAEAAVRRIAETYDEAHGGFGRAPKFPTPGKLLLLWESGGPGSEEHEMVVETLRKMGRGGIYDHLGGGFHRYSTDARWLVPHFEKMLYDNAHLAELLALAWRETGDPELARLARGTLEFVLRELTRPEGSFKSAIDAQTDGEEGAYYVWSEEELRSVLGEEGFALLAPIYGFDGRPSFEGERYVLHLTAPLEEHAERLETSREELLERLQPHLERLLTARGERDRPLVDDKVLADWNGMMIAGMARAGAILDEPRYLEAAEEATRFVLERLGPDPDAGLPLRHAWRGGAAKIDAFLDDYAFLLRGLVALHEATGEERWLTHAARLADELERRLAAPGGGYYLSEARPELLVQPLTVTGGALPSGNAAAADTLLALAEKTGEERFRERAERSLRAFAPQLERFPDAVPMLAAAVLRYHAGGPAGPGGTQEPARDSEVRGDAPGDAAPRGN